VTRIVLGALVTAAPVAAEAQRAGSVDLVLVGGKIFTADSTRPWATAIAIRGERIVAVGSDAEIEALRGARTRRIVLDGRVVVPGFNDAHAHLGADIAATRFATSTDPTPDPAFSVVVDSIRAIATRTPAGSWITTGIAERILGDPAARRAALDSAAPRHNVYLRGWSGHGAVLNSSALRAARLDTIRDVLGGWLERDASGAITGRIDEYLHFALGQRRTVTGGVPATVAAFGGQNREMLAFGITSVQDMTTGYTPPLLQAAHRARALQVRHRVIPFEMTRTTGRERRWPSQEVGAASPVMQGSKWVLDGTPIERLALMRQPYADRAGWYGRANLPIDTLRSLLRDMLRQRQQPIFHTVGDSAIALVFTAMRSVAPDSVWRSLRPRLEHADNLMPDQYDAAKALGIVVVQNPTHLGLAMLADRWGPERLARSEALRGIVAAGIPLAIGSDGPLNTGLNLMLATLNPANPAQALTREQAVMAYTLMSAWAEHLDTDKGSLAPGKLADLAVLSQDIFSVPPPAMPATTSVLTIVGGRIVHGTLPTALPGERSRR
jgi:predicted amidohydrolase YtcJ